MSFDQFTTFVFPTFLQPTTDRASTNIRRTFYELTGTLDSFQAHIFYEPLTKNWQILILARAGQQEYHFLALEAPALTVHRPDVLEVLFVRNLLPGARITVWIFSLPSCCPVPLWWTSCCWWPQQYNVMSSWKNTHWPRRVATDRDTDIQTATETYTNMDICWGSLLRECAFAVVPSSWSRVLMCRRTVVCTGRVEFWSCRLSNRGCSNLIMPTI